jgi:hypothetical protein
MLKSAPLSFLSSVLVQFHDDGKEEKVVSRSPLTGLSSVLGWVWVGSLELLALFDEAAVSFLLMLLFEILC